jgi:hypothetical protein
MRIVCATGEVEKMVLGMTTLTTSTPQYPFETCSFVQFV